jgi:hypothetical protein
MRPRAFPDYRAQGIELHRREVAPSKLGEKPFMVVENQTEYLVARMTSTTSDDSLRFGIGTDGSVAVPKGPMSLFDFRAPAQHVVSINEASQEEVLGLYAAGLRDALVIGGPVGEVVDIQRPHEFDGIFNELGRMGPGPWFQTAFICRLGKVTSKYLRHYFAAFSD